MELVTLLDLLVATVLSERRLLLEAAVAVSKTNLDNQVVLVAETVLMVMERVLVDLAQQVRVSLVELALQPRMVLLVAVAVLLKQVKLDITDQTLVQQEVETDTHLLSLVLHKLMVVVAVALTTLVVPTLQMEEVVVVVLELSHLLLMETQAQVVLVEAAAVLLTKILATIQNPKVAMVAAVS